jgi:hypothetical protein
VQVQPWGKSSKLEARFDRSGQFRTALANELAGWLGASALLLAFGLGATSVVSPSSVAYLALNLFGAVGLAYVSLSRRAYSPAFLNVVWAVIAALSLVILLIRA